MTGSGGRANEPGWQLPWAVVGRYCPTDANPETDAAALESVLVVSSRAEAEKWLLWYPGGKILPASFVIEAAS